MPCNNQPRPLDLPENPNEYLLCPNHWGLILRWRIIRNVYGQHYEDFCWESPVLYHFILHLFILIHFTAYLLRLFFVKYILPLYKYIYLYTIYNYILPLYASIFYLFMQLNSTFIKQNFNLEHYCIARIKEANLVLKSRQKL